MLIEFVRSDATFTVTKIESGGSVTFGTTIDNDPCSRVASFMVTESAVDPENPTEAPLAIGATMEFSGTDGVCTLFSVSVQALDSDGANVGSPVSSSGMTLHNGGEFSKFCSYTWCELRKILDQSDTRQVG